MLTDRRVRALLDACGKTHGEEIDCEEFLAAMAPYAEALAAGRALPEDAVRVVEHDALCANCHEECETLVEMIRAEGGPGTGLIAP